jgi:hypothetical protein
VAVAVAVASGDLCSFMQHRANQEANVSIECKILMQYLAAICSTTQNTENQTRNCPPLAAHTFDNKRFITSRLALDNENLVAISCYLFKRLQKRASYVCHSYVIVSAQSGNRIPPHQITPAPWSVSLRRQWAFRQPHCYLQHPTSTIEVSLQSDAKSPQLLEVIRVAVKNVEQSSGVAPDDPALVELRQNVVRTVGELEVAKAKRQDQDEEPPSTLVSPSK